MTSIARSGLCLVTGAALVACAAAPKSAQAPSGGNAEEPPAATSPQQPRAYPPGTMPGPQAGAPADAAPAPAAPPPPPPSPPPPASSPYAQPPNRTAAIAQAGNEIDSSQRELDVAGGDCRNACRALGSMDRAAGRLCALAQSNDEVRRCGDAKTRLYSARDKVRNTCGTCPDVSVDRGAPIPSTRREQ